MIYQRLFIFLVAAVVLTSQKSTDCLADEVTKIPAAKASASATEDSTKSPNGADPRFEKLKSMLNNVALVGMFTVDKKPMKELKEERYEIKSIEKMSGDNELWSMEARIKYGKHDVTLPIVVTMKWAGETPVIVMDKLLIPGLGTFSSRVVFHDGKYAGTWIHDDNGGHLFGKIEAIK
jgi:hypothetical protein